MSSPPRLGGPSGQSRGAHAGLLARAQRCVAAWTQRPAPGTDRGVELSALNTLIASRGDARLRPLPWRRMAWVTWRQHRLALAGGGALLRGAGPFPLGIRFPLATMRPALCARPPTASH